MVDENILRAKAAKKGLSIWALEKAAELGNGAIGKWFNNKNPNIETIKKVADVLGCTVDDLLVKEVS